MKNKKKNKVEQTNNSSVSAEYAKQKKLILRNVNKKYKMDNKQTFQALYDVNVDFCSGELVSIIGESGSGKSTLMNLIGGLDSDFSGEIIADGENLKNLTDKQLDKYRKNKIGFVFQSFNLISHLSILDNVTLALTLSNVGKKEKEEKARNILAKLGLESQIKKKPTQLSGGQKQRVAIARALINDPEIIIADEPTGALDSDTSMQILEILKEIADGGKLVIMVTHSEKVASVSSRVVEISDGRIISDKINENYKKNESTFINKTEELAEVEKNAEETENAEGGKTKSAAEEILEENSEKNAQIAAETEDNSSNGSSKISSTSKKETSKDLTISSNSNKTTEKIEETEEMEATEATFETQQNNLNSANSISAKATKSKKKKKKFGKEKQNLSMYSAIRLSLHNMWASKAKNFLMAFGVAIGIGSLILMMCFSSGITDYIDDIMKSYSDPTIVTISKQSDSDSFLESLAGYNPFSDTEIEELVEDINAYLADEGYDFEVTYGENNSDEYNLSYGVQLMTAMSSTLSAKVIYDPDNIVQEGAGVDYFNNSDGTTGIVNFEDTDLGYLDIVYLYTIPPYYTSSNVSEGKMATSEGGVMFSKTITSLFSDGSITNPDGSARKVDVAIYYEDGIPFYGETITGIMDTSVMSGFLTMYIDYNYFEKLFVDSTGKELSPNTIYIQTTSEEITNAINTYISTLDGYSGSIEDSLANMFTSMSSVIGTSLVVISSISLLVSAMMILVVMYMSVSERTKEIGVLKSIGARRKDIKRIFTSESFLVGLLSGIIGILFNLILTAIIALVLNSLIGLCPLSYRWWYFALAIGVAVVISMLAGLYPASKAAKLDPVESLRRE